MRGFWPLFLSIGVVVSLFAVALTIPATSQAGNGNLTDLIQYAVPTTQAVVPPQDNGTIPVGTWNTSYIDRYSTNVSVVVFYPATKAGDSAPKNKTEAPYPFLDFMHGHLFYPPYTYYVSWGEHYASLGYVVAMPNFQAYDGLLTSNHGEMANSTLDLITAMAKKNATSGGFLQGMVNVNNTALTGHSLGAKIAVLAEEDEASRGLKNVRAVETLAFANANAPSTFFNLSSIHVPVQLQTGTLDAVAYPSQNSQVVYNGLGTPPKQFVNITGGNHYHYADEDPSFGELGDNTSTITRAAQLTLGEKYATAFFNYYLKGETQYWTYLYGADAKSDLKSGAIAWNEFANIPPSPLPTKPLNLKSLPGGSQVALSWTAPPGNPAIPITNYKVYRGSASGTETFLKQIGNLTSYNDTGLASCKVYYYNVTAVNSYGEGPSSNETSATTLCTVSFVENGLPSGTHWSVKLGTSTNSSTSNTITFPEPNGAYAYTIGNVGGYTATPSSGNLTVSGANVNQTILFTTNGTAVYQLSFDEMGLPSGTSWSATVNGSTTSSTTSSVLFNEPNGAYSYTVQSTSLYTANPSSGIAHVSGANVAVHVNFTSTATILVSVAVTPGTASLDPGGTQPFTATSTCSTTCPSNVTYLWALTRSSIGTLSSSSGSQVTFTAGDASGSAGLFVNATLGSTTVQSLPAKITVTASASSLVSVSVDPATAALGPGLTQPFSAVPACTSTCPSGIAYSWSLTNSLVGAISGSTGPSVTFTAGSTSGTAGLFVNATLNGVTVQSTAGQITVSVSTLESVAVTPTSANLGAGGTQTFTATPDCTATCPSGTTYSWALTNGALGALSATAGASVTFTAGTTSGSVGLFLNATLNGVTKPAPETTISVTGTSYSTVLSGVSISPRVISLSAGASEVFSASPACTNDSISAPCPSGIVYTWTLNSTDGSMSGMTGASATFTAGNSGGVIQLTVTATLDGVAMSDATTITITAPSTSASSGSTNLLLWGCIIAVVAAVAVVTAVFLLMRKTPGQPSPQPSFQEPPPPQ
jgi:hypothetical protein